VRRFWAISSYYQAKRRAAQVALPRKTRLLRPRAPVARLDAPGRLNSPATWADTEKDGGPGRTLITKITKYRERSDHKALVLKRYRRSLDRCIVGLFGRVMSCTTESAVDAAVALARQLDREGIGSRTWLLALRCLGTNHSQVVKALVGRRNPLLLLSSLRPSWYLLREVFRLLTRFRREELEPLVLYALLGVIQTTYKTSKYGYRIYPLSVSDVHNVGKYLDKNVDQSDQRNRYVLDLLFDIYALGVDSTDRLAKRVALVANDIRMAYFDNTKRIVDVVPSTLLIADVRRQEVSSAVFGGAVAEPARAPAPAPEPAPAPRSARRSSRTRQPARSQRRGRRT
jgi:hypothetical protein